jgi:hypothetical protein
MTIDAMVKDVETIGEQGVKLFGVVDDSLQFRKLATFLAQAYGFKGPIVTCNYEDLLKSNIANVPGAYWLVGNMNGRWKDAVQFLGDDAHVKIASVGAKSYNPQLLGAEEERIVDKGDIRSYIEGLFRENSRYAKATA